MISDRRLKLAAAALVLVVLALIAVPIIHGIHPNGGLGLGDGVVGAGTLLLAIGTGGLALRTSAMAEATRKLAEETRTGIGAAGTQFRQERMPVVMPIATVGDGPAETQMRVPYPRYLDDMKQEIRLFIPIENVGAGPALDITTEVYWLDQNGARSVSSTQPMETRKGVLPALGPGHEGLLAADFRGLAITPMMAFRLTMTYKDGAGDLYKLASTFYPKTKSYGPMGFLPPEELGLPMTLPQPIPMPERLIRDRATSGTVDQTQEIAADVYDPGIPAEDDGIY